jgi:hypothetical protein
LKNLSIYIFIALNFCLWSRIFSQDLNYFHYSVDEGLPSSQVHDIIQDKYGNLWFSTDHGLSQYNGYTFENYTTNNGISDNIVFKFFKQANGDIWCTTFNKSLFSITGNKPVFKSYLFNKILTGLPDGFIANDLHVSNDGAVFVSVVGGVGYIHIDRNGEVVKNTIKRIEQFPYETVLVNENENGDFFFSKPLHEPKQVSGKWNKVIFSNQHNQGDDYLKACYFDEFNKGIFTNPRNILILNDKFDSINIPSKFEPISLGKLSGNRFWVGYRYGGIEIFDLNGQSLQTFLPGKSVTKLFVDHEGGYWFSTLNDGVFHARSSLSINVFSFAETANTWINSLCRDSKGNLIVGFYNGDVAKVSGKKIQPVYSSVTKKPAITCYDPLVKECYFSSDNKLFRAAGNKMLYDIKLFPLSFYVHKNDSILIAGYAGIKVKYKEKESYISTGFRVNDVCFYANKLYAATNKGLYMLKGSGLTIANKDSILFASPISDVDEWGSKLVLATKGSGILIVQNNTVFQVRRKDGLSDDIVSEVYVENDSIVWACTNTGLNRIGFAKGKVSGVAIISNHNGLISNEVSDLEIMNDTVWVGTRQGLCFFPLTILKRESVDRDYFLDINTFKVNDKIYRKSHFDLSYFENRIEFGFKAVSFFEFSPILYRYKLNGLETKWNYSRALSIVYSSLPPGSYSFLLQARGDNHTWIKGEQVFSFIIHPPFWKTGWFIASVLIFVGILIYLFFKFKILSYNRDITRELLRQLLKHIKGKSGYVVFREQGKDIRILSQSIVYVKAEGNYIEIYCDSKKYVIRYKISEFLELVPDPLEYLRINRSYIIRLDKVQEKSKKDVTIDGKKIMVGETYLDQLEKIKF